MTDQHEEQQEVFDDSDLKKYRIELPNLYDDADLDPYEFRLLAHYKRVGTCTESTKTTGTKTHMSAAQVSEKRLSLHNKGFIVMQTVYLDEEKKRFSYSITVVDRWLENFKKYSTLSRGKRTPSLSERPLHSVKQRKNHIKKEPIKKDIVLSEKENEEVKAEAKHTVDTMLLLMEAPGMKKQTRVDSILSYLAGVLNINTETKRWKEFAEYVDNRQQNHGEKIDRFTAWLTGQKNFDIQYWSPARMREMWPQAFIKEVTQVIQNMTEEQDWRKGLTF